MIRNKNNYNYKNRNYNNKKSIYCLNCGKSNHNYNECIEPSNSYGILCFISKDKCKSVLEEYIENLKKLKTITISNNDDTNYELTETNKLNLIDDLSEKNQRHQENEKNDISNLDNSLMKSNSNLIINNKVSSENKTKCNYVNSKFNNSKNKLKDSKYNLLMIRRKHSFSYVEFLRGKFSINDTQYIHNLFSKMTKEEIEKIQKINNFTNLRKDLGMENKKKYYKNEYEMAEMKFNYLLKLNILEPIINNILKNEVTNSEPEWEIPKGKRQNRETDLQCAMREFSEESGINVNCLRIFKNVLPLEEIYTGTNGINYKNTYFFAELIDLQDKLFHKNEFINNNQILKLENINLNNINLKLNYFNLEQRKEVGKILISDINLCINRLKQYQTNKKSIILKAFQIINQYKTYFNFTF